MKNLKLSLLMLFVSSIALAGGPFDTKTNAKIDPSIAGDASYSQECRNASDNYVTVRDLYNEHARICGEVTRAATSRDQESATMWRLFDISFDERLRNDANCRAVIDDYKHRSSDARDAADRLFWEKWNDCHFAERFRSVEFNYSRALSEVCRECHGRLPPTKTGDLSDICPIIIRD